MKLSNLKPRHLVLPLGAAVGAFVLSGCWSAFGQPPKGEDLTKVKRSSNYEERQFQNSVETKSAFDWNSFKVIGSRIASGLDRTPQGTIPVVKSDKEQLSKAWDGEGVRFTWFGHATVLVEIDGFRILTDPVWSERCSPVSFAGPRRFHDMGLSIDDLPPIDAVVISHDHYDHLDEKTVKALGKKNVPFYVPLGVGSHLRYWGVSNIHESDWWQERTITKLGKSVKLIATPARHFSGRGPLGRNETLWASWAFIGAKKRVWFGGDTGYFDGFKEIGEKLGPFDLTIVPIGAYDKLWQPVHLNPTEAIQAHQDVRGKAMIPIHWGTFNLAFHSWVEPIEWAWDLAKEKEVSLYTPKPGETLVTSKEPSSETWWELGK